MDVQNRSPELWEQCGFIPPPPQLFLSLSPSLHPFLILFPSRCACVSEWVCVCVFLQIYMNVKYVFILPNLFRFIMTVYAHVSALNVSGECSASCIHVYMRLTFAFSRASVSTWFSVCSTLLTSESCMGNLQTNIHSVIHSSCWWFPLTICSQERRNQIDVDTTNSSESQTGCVGTYLFFDLYNIPQSPCLYCYWHHHCGTWSTYCFQMTSL